MSAEARRQRALLELDSVRHELALPACDVEGDVGAGRAGDLREVLTRLGNLTLIGAAYKREGGRCPR